MVTRVAILGATGSIGRQALEVVMAHPDRLRATVLASRRNADDLAILSEDAIDVLFRFGLHSVLWR